VSSCWLTLINEGTDSPVYVCGVVLDDCNTRTVWVSCDYLYPKFDSQMYLILIFPGSVIKNLTTSAFKIIVSTMGLKPSPSGETFRFYPRQSGLIKVHLSFQMKSCRLARISRSLKRETLLRERKDFSP